MSWASDAGDPQPPKYPVPSHVSNSAKAMLNRPIDLHRASQVPVTKQQWLTSIERVSGNYQHMLAVARSAPVSIEKTKMAGVTVRIITPTNLPISNKNKVLMNLHGGAYIHFGGDLSVLEGIAYAAAGQYRVVAVDYRMPPNDPFPAAVDDAVAVYNELLKTYLAKNIIIFGGSAGGGLTAACILKARDQGLRMPAAAIMNTPWSDLSKTGDSYYTNAGVDPILPTYDGVLGASAELYAGDYDLKHPLVSPVYADYSKGFPPSLLITGTRDLLLSSTVRLHLKLKEANIPAELLVFDAMWHGFSADPRLPEAQLANREVFKFIDRVFSSAQ
ncbi:MAG: alpha/beta hydrolase [Pseudomonadales bacterium]